MRASHYTADYFLRILNARPQDWYDREFDINETRKLDELLNGPWDPWRVPKYSWDAPVGRVMLALQAAKAKGK